MYKTDVPEAHLLHQFLAYCVDFGFHALFSSDDPRVEGLAVPGHEDR